MSASQWTSRRAVLSTVALVVWVPGCAVAAWWQVGIALGGDGLGWVYSVMWPMFAIFGVVFWWYLIHDDPDTVGARGLRQLRLQHELESDGLEDDLAIMEAEAEDPELAAYNAYLAGLAERPKTWRKS